MRSVFWLCLCLAVVGLGCESDDPEGVDLSDAGDGSGGATGGSGGGSHGGTGGSADGGSGGGAPPVVCEPGESDFPGDAWPECISDDGEFHPFRPDNISSMARVAAFEQIADQLWRDAIAPGSRAFIDAQLTFVEDEGLGSRVARRYDVHYPTPGDDVSCRDETGLDHPDYCVGPARILPIVNNAFDAGIGGTDAGPSAARIEAALLWFLYVSTFKEANTCKGAAKDCDSSWAYYTGGHQRDGGIGLSGYLRRLEPETHERIFDGILAVRCWRHLDDAEEATNDEMMTDATTQLDRALDRGLAVLLIDRLETLADSDGVERAAAWAFLEVLGPVADRAARLIDAGAADRLAAVWAGTADAVDIDAAIADLEILFPCP